MGKPWRTPVMMPVHALIEAARPLLPLPRSIKLTVVADPSAVVEVDRVSFMRIMINLVDNAAQAMDNVGTIHVVVQVDGKEVVIDVADSGPGVPAELGERIFDLQFSTRGGRNDQRGYGLSISRELAKVERGGLELLDTPPPGATFRLRLPMFQDGLGRELSRTA